MNTKKWLWGTAVGLVVGILVSSAMTYQDWCLNPGGIFYSEDQGTYWPFVWETWISWFFPITALSLAIALVAFYLIPRPRP